MLTATAAWAQGPVSRSVIKTGGEKGAYHTAFCPPLEPVLKGAQFPAYKCTACQQGQPCGSVANIDYLTSNPGAIVFSQLDVYARAVQQRPDLAEKTQVMKQLACEGIWLPDASAVIAAVAKSDNDVGIFVQFADPSNANIKAMMDPEKKLHVIPVVSRALSRARVAEQPVYQVQSFELAGGWGSKEVQTTCTPVVIVGSKAAAFKDRNDADDQKDLIEQVGKMSEEQLLPKQGGLAALMKKMRKLSDAAMDKTYETIEASRKRMETTQ
jgi:hypothetical protein